MNRRHTRADYLRVIERLREARPDMAFSSDFIVGFPGETESDFRDTLDLHAEVGFASAYSFKYSPRPGTPAADMEQLAEAVKDERLQRLQDAIERAQAAFMERCVGKTFDVLFDKPGRHPGQIVGRSPYLQPVPVVGPTSLIGEVAPVTVIEVRTNSLYGRLANARTPDAPMLAGIGA
jgi:tRNA-2-methylthio-N6-dimethylallyladenosine synthase